MNREGLLQNPLPVDRVAARVVRASKPDDLWRPMPKKVETYPPTGEVLQIAPIPKSALLIHPELGQLAGKKRGRLTIIGYAADQPDNSKRPARWVVRCACGNYEHRSRILRWVTTEANDMCRECAHRLFLIGGKPNSPEPAKRLTLERMRSAND